MTTKLSIPIKYGLLITAGVIVWVLLAHQLVPNTDSLVHTLGAATFFNVLQFVMIYLGLKAKEREYGDKQDFKKGLKTGVAISFAYGLSTVVFFLILVAFVGAQWLPPDPGAINLSPSMRVAKAFAGVFIGALFLGLIYSTVISFFLAKRQSEER